MSDIPDNVDLQWVARHILALRDDVKALRGDVSALRDDVDKLIVIVRRVRDEADVTALMLVRIERRLEKLETA